MSGHADTIRWTRAEYRAEVARLLAENQRLREALEQIAVEWDGQLGTGQMLTDFVRDALAGEDG